MKKTISILALIILCAALLAGCECEHYWRDATCAAPMTCALCGETTGETLEHTWIDATCSTPMTCNVCGQTSGEPAGHHYESLMVGATEFTEGYTIHTCTVCRDSYTDSQTPALGYYITEGDLIFKSDGFAYLYDSYGVKETFTGWMDEVYKIEDDYEVNAGGFLVTSPFFCRDDIYRVIIEDGVSLKSTAYLFYACYEMRSIHIGSDVTSLGEAMLAECSSISQITFGKDSKLTAIESGAMGSLTLNSQFVIPSGVTHLGSLPITSQPIVLNEGLVSIGEYTLYGSNIVLPSTVTQIGKGNMEHLVIPDGHPHFKMVDNCLIQSDTKTLVDVAAGFILPTDGSITAIGDGALRGVQLSAIEIPEGVTSIGKQAFYSCNAQTITLPNSITQIGKEAFSCCRNLTQINLPAGLTEIPEDAFSYCVALEAIDIPSNITSIGANAFVGCYSLRNVVLSRGLTSIGAGAFAICESIAELTLPDSLTTIGNYAFQNCILTTLEIPASVTQIGRNPILGCSNLTELTVAQDNPEYYISGNCLVGRSSKTLIVGIGNAAIPDDGSVEIIGDEAFSNNVNITKITIPKGVTAIGYSAFRGCINLTQLVLPDTLEYYGDVCFDDCPLLAYIDYQSTTAQWANVRKGDYQWMSGENFYQIRCTDGILSPWG